MLMFGISIITAFLFVLPSIISPAKIHAEETVVVTQEAVTETPDVAVENETAELVVETPAPTELPPPEVEEEVGVPGTPVIEEIKQEEPVVAEPVVELPVDEEPVVNAPELEIPEVVQEAAPVIPLVYEVAPVVTVNKEDYKPGGRVNMKGEGWILDSAVTILVEEVFGDWKYEIEIAVDSKGKFTKSFNIADYYTPDYTVAVTGKDTGKVVETSFTDDGGAYSIDFSSYNPDTYKKYIAKYFAPLTEGTTGRYTDKLDNTLHSNTVESLNPQDLVLGQIVPFEAEITVIGSTIPENGVIDIEMLWSTVTTSGSAFGYDGDYMVYAAFVDIGDSDDPGEDATVTAIDNNPGSGFFSSIITVEGLDNGDKVVVEVWVVLQDSLPDKITGNNDSSLVSAETASGSTINTGSQVVPLKQPSDFLDYGSLSIVKTFTGYPVGFDLPDQITVQVTGVSYSFPLVININQTTGIGTVTQPGLVPGTYTIAEISVPGWAVSYPDGRSAIVVANETATLDILNLNNETTSVSGTKTWIGPAGSTLVRLYADGVLTGDTRPLDATHLTYEFTGLDKYHNTTGELIVYTVTEDPMVGWTESQNGFDFRNVNDETTSVSGTKTWIGPAGSTTVHLFADGVDTGLTRPLDETHLTYEFTGLDKYNNTNGNLIIYTVIEDDMVGWTESQNGFDFRNVNDETTSVSGTKTWIGPAGSTLVHLFADGVDTGLTRPLDETHLTYEFTGLDKYNNVNGDLIVYTVMEDDMVGWSESQDGFDFTNTNDETTTVSGTKTWIGPAGSTLVHLFADGVDTGLTRPLDETHLTYEFTGLDKYNNTNGDLIVYTVLEDDMVGWTESQDGFDFTNTNDETTSVSGTKTWIGPAGSTLVHLFADGVDTGLTRPLDETHLTYEFTGLDKYNNTNGDLIVYTVLEDDMVGWTESQDGFDFTNTNDETTTVSGTKTWIGPAGSTLVHLFADGVDTGLTRPLDETHLTYEFTGLDKYNNVNGDVIVYTVMEDDMVGWSESQDGFDFTNINDETTSVSGTKTWIGPAGSTLVHLFADGVDTGLTRPLDETHLTYEFTGLDKYNNVNGDVIVYTVMEDDMVGWTESQDGFDFTNTNDETTTVSGTKTWIGPAGSTLVHLFADGVDTGLTRPLDETHLTYGFTGLDKYNNTNGDLIVYTVLEDDMVGWTESQDGFDFTNTNDETTSVSGTKTWIGPAGSTLVHLYADGEDTGLTRPLDETHLTYEFTGLDKYNNTNGDLIVYTVIEDDMAGWTESQDGFDFTNTNDETTSVSGTKTWIGPAGSTLVHLSADGEDTGLTRTLDADNLTYEFTGLDKYNNINGELIVYTVTEDDMVGWTESQDGFDFTNINDETTMVSGTKTWIGPAGSTLVHLFADGVDTGLTRPLDEAHLTYEFTGLDKYNNTNGDLIVYTVLEDDMVGWTESQDGFDFTNTNDETTSVSGTKTWIGPAGSTLVHLYADGEDTGLTRTLDADNLTYEFTGLDKYNNINGELIVYTVMEDDMEGWTESQDGFDFTNINDETTMVSGTKTWIGPAGSTLVHLLADGEDTGLSKPLDADNLIYEFTGLDKYNNINGELIVYTVIEDPMEGWTESQDGFDFTNINDETTIVSGTKTWIGPAGSTLVHLYADGEDTGLTRILDDTHMRYEFTGLDKYNDVNGELIVYTVMEDLMEGWTESQDGFDFTNINDETTTVSGTKTWIGMPGSTMVHLYADGEDTGLSAPLDATHLTYEFAGLDKYNNVNGELIVYTVMEDLMDGWTESQDGFDFTNTYVPPVEDITGTKIWMGGPTPRPTIQLQLWRVIPEGVPEKVGDPVELPDGTSEYMWEDMPTTDMDGNLYTYSVEEVVTGENYEKIEEGMEVTNEYVSPKTYVTVEKIWVGGPEPRPTIYIQLYRNITEGEKVKVGEPVGLPSGTNEYTWNNLDVTDYDGNPYIYSVEEADVAGYVKVIEGYEISNTRIKGTIEFHKHDDAHMPLAGAVFGLYAMTDTMFATPLKTATSLADGLVRFTDVDYGEYKIKEISASVGYEKSELVIPVAVTMQGQTVIPTPATVVNVKIMGDITLRKVDSVTEEVLAGAKLVIKDKAGAVVFEGTTGADGILKVMLPYGEYIVSEVAAPEGYILTTQTYSINVNKSGLTFNVEIQNTEEEELPQTGGIPSELLYLMGAMAIIGGAILMKGKRRTIG